MKYHTTTENNLVSTNPVIRDDQALIHIGTPSHTVTPYDVYARFIVRDARLAFARAGVSAEVVTCHRRIASVGFGSGPGGAVRLGDDMIPPDVQAVIAIEDASRARQAWEEYKGRKYLQKPYSVIGNLWFDRDAERGGTAPWFGNTGAWVTGGAWSKTILNAIAIAHALGRNTSRLETYFSRRATPDA